MSVKPDAMTCGLHALLSAGACLVTQHDPTRACGVSGLPTNQVDLNEERSKYQVLRDDNEALKIHKPRAMMLSIDARHLNSHAKHNCRTGTPPTANAHVNSEVRQLATTTAYVLGADLVGIWLCC